MGVPGETEYWVCELGSFILKSLARGVRLVRQNDLATDLECKAALMELRSYDLAHIIEDMYEDDE